MLVHPKENEEYVIILRSRIRLKNGKYLYASQVGKKAFPIKVRKKQ